MLWASTIFLIIVIFDMFTHLQYRSECMVTLKQKHRYTKFYLHFCTPRLWSGSYLPMLISLNQFIPDCTQIPQFQRSGDHTIRSINAPTSNLKQYMISLHKKPNESSINTNLIFENTAHRISKQGWKFTFSSVNFVGEK